jgi:hypothetical protein
MTVAAMAVAAMIVAAAAAAFPGSLPVAYPVRRHSRVYVRVTPARALSLLMLICGHRLAAAVAAAVTAVLAVMTVGRIPLFQGWLDVLTGPLGKVGNVMMNQM